MKKTFFFALVLLGTALLLASGNAPALGKDILLQGMLHNKFNVIDGDKDEIVATIETKGKKVTNFTWDPRDLDKVYTITDWGQQIEQLDLAGKKVVRTFRWERGTSRSGRSISSSIRRTPTCCTRSPCGSGGSPTRSST